MNKSLVKFELLYTKSSVKDIQKLDSVAKKKLKKKLELYCRSPLTQAKKLTDSSIGSYRWRTGNYRIIFDVSGNKIIILKVGHRREIYK